MPELMPLRTKTYFFKTEILLPKFISKHQYHLIYAVIESDLSI